MNAIIARLKEQWAIIRFLIDNFSWIVISLVLALIIWLVASMDENPIQEREFSVSIGITFVEDSTDDVILLNTTTTSPVRSARVTIRAPRSTWNELERDDLEIVADLRGRDVGTQMVDLEGRIINDELTGSVIEVSPAEIEVEIVSVTQKTLTINRQIDEFISNEYDVSVPLCDFTEVNISGPGEVISRISSAEIRLTLRNPEQLDYRASVLLFAEDRVLSGRDRDSIQISPEQITCQFQISRTEGTPLLVNPMIVGVPPAGYTIGERTVDPQSVLVVGDPDLIASLGGVVDTEPIDTTDQVNQFTRTVDVVLPDGLSLRPENTRIVVTVDIDPITTTLQFAEVPVQIANIDLAFVASVVPETINITIEGPEPDIAPLTPDDFNVVVDLRRLGEGTYTDLPLTVTITRESLQAVETELIAQPGTVSVVITRPAPPVPFDTTPPEIRIIG